MHPRTSTAIRFTASVFMLVFAVALFGGCATVKKGVSDWWNKNKPEVKLETPSDTDGTKTSTPAATETSTVTEKTEATTTSSADAISPDSVEWLGTPVKAAAPITATLTGAQISGDKILTQYQPYSWPSNNDKDKPCDALVHLFYRKGDKIVGGKFDYWRNGGQGVKGLENLRTGYHGHSMPTKGTLTWTMISSLDGKQRSNVVKVDWK